VVELWMRKGEKGKGSGRWKRHLFQPRLQATRTVHNDNRAQGVAEPKAEVETEQGGRGRGSLLSPSTTSLRLA
jgi:hypothetical protein